MCVKLITEIEDKEIIENFDCEEDSINEFLKYYAKEYNKNGEGITYVILDEEFNKIVGYYTIKCNAIQTEETNGDKIVHPAVEITRLGVDKNYKKKGNGNLCLGHAINQTNELKSIVGIKMVFLYSLPEAEGFYSKFGLRYLSPSYNQLECEDSCCTPMYRII